MRALPWLLIAACADPAAPPPKRVAGLEPAVVTGPYHDPDHKRGELPDDATRRLELGVVRSSLDTMYAHRLDKERRHSIDEDALFAATETQLLAAKSWGGYDSVLYDMLVKFHDSHLTYHPPPTAAPARGYTSFHLGLETVLAHDRLLIKHVEPGDVAAAGIVAGDEVIAIDRRPIADVLAQSVAGRVWSRPESAETSFAETWTTVLYPVGDPPRARTIRVRRRAGGELDVAITPREAAKVKREIVTTAIDGGIATVTIRSLDGNRDRAKDIDAALATARGAKAIVIDLRGDRGGVDLVGYRIVADLAEGTASLGTYRVLAAAETFALRPKWKSFADTAGADGYTAPQSLTIDALPHRYRGKVAVVVDAGCVSTCEVVAAALRADVHAIIVGETTGGSSGAPVEVTLPTSRSKIAIPTWNLIAADGHAIEGDGVVPDVEVVATPDALAANQDLPLREAQDRVRGP